MIRSAVSILRRRAESLFADEPDGAVESASWWRRPVQLLYLVVREASRDLCLERAAALAFTSVASFIPLAILLLFLFGTFRGFDDIVADCQDWVIRNLGAEEHRAVNEAQLAALVGALRNPLEGRERTVNVVAFLVLLATGYSLFRSSERTFNVIWKAEKRRSLVRKIGGYWMLLTAPPLILILARYVREMISRHTGGDVLSVVLSVSISFFAFTLVFMYLPNVRVHANTAAAGALLAAVGWEVGTEAFFLYVREAVVASVYGALGVIPFFLLWVYFSWVVTLVGAELAYCVQNFRALEEGVRQHITGERLPRSVCAVVLIDRVYRSYGGHAAPAAPAAVAAEMRVPVAVIEAVAGRLVEEGYLVQSAGGVLSPTRAPERVTLLEIMDRFPPGASWSLEGLPPESEHSAVVVRLKELAGEHSSRLAGATFGNHAGRSAASGGEVEGT
ncbi:MAG: YihY/virulence factor BrkB family protein [Planctomycetes bacterium]|nr:YihY/virulence factor BrkB family protein [Planctomycetota bacterium]